MCPTSRDTTLYFVVRPRAVEIVSDLQLHDPLASAGGTAPPDSPVHGSGVCPGQRADDQAASGDVWIFAP